MEGGVEGGGGGGGGVFEGIFEGLEDEAEAERWDAIGATWHGYTTLWVNRAGLPLEQLDTEPTRIGSSLRAVLDFFPTLPNRPTP